MTTFKAKGAVAEILDHSKIIIDLGFVDNIEVNDIGEFYIGLPVFSPRNDMNLGIAEIELSSFVVTEVFEKCSIIAPIQNDYFSADEIQLYKFNIDENQVRELPNKITIGTYVRIIDTSSIY